MEIDYDYDEFMPPEEEESAPPDQNRKLKRLKKAISSLPKTSPSNPNPSTSESEFKILVQSDELMRSGSRSSGLGGETELGSFDSLFSEKKRPAVKRVLGFDDVGSEGEFGENREGLVGDVGLVNENKRATVDEEFDDGRERKKAKMKTKRAKSVGESEKKKNNTAKCSAAGDGMLKFSKRKETKADKAELIEYQRRLRERTNVEFKAASIVEKPISLVLEKIRQRKLELSKKRMTTLSSKSHGGPLRGLLLDDDVDDIPVLEKVGAKHKESVSRAPIMHLVVKDAASNASSVDVCHEATCQSTHERTSSSVHLDEKSMEEFRAPATDTQDLFSDSQTGDTQDDQSKEATGEAMQDDLSPSLLAMNLKLDSAPPDVISSDEEENDKENIDPLLQQPLEDNSSPNGDPVKEFVDEEAVEEDDSDDDVMRFQDEEESDFDAKEIDDLIATDYKEKPIDFENRNQLHQMWLEQQDEDGIGNLMQRLKCGVKQREINLLEEDEGNTDGENEVGIDEEDLFPPNAGRVNTRKLKQMIPQMFTDKDDGFLSSDEEETEKRLSKQRMLEKVELEEQVRFVSPAEDETSREVFGRIKKLNILPETKKKATTLSFFDTLLKKGSSNGSKKSSFLHRASKHPAVSTNRHGSSTARSFIFARDDSNSRSSATVSEDSQDLKEVQKENQPKRNVSAKFTGSQARLSTQRTEMAAQTVSGISLFDMLRHSSIVTHHSATENMVDHQVVFAAFKSVKKSVKFEGRS
ncbi:hypothetical protein Ancab_016210 [Ancistrocladus abbreviatus]